MSDRETRGQAVGGRDVREAFEEALTRLEEAVVAPVLPGELHAWCERSSRALEPLLEVWDQAAERRAQLLSETADTDLGLAARVEHLEQESDALSQSLQRFAKRWQELREAAREGGTSREPITAARTLREEMLQWIVRCRAVHREIRGWYMESAYRDRGAVD